MSNEPDASAKPARVDRATTGATTVPKRRKSTSAAAAAASTSDRPDAAANGLSATAMGSLGGASEAPTSASGVQFLTSAKSPFADHYDIEGERALLRDLIDADDPDATDPRYLRLLEYYERQGQLDRKVFEHKDRGGADPVISTPEAVAVKRLGGYIASRENSVTLHTKEAYRLFTGRAKDPTPGRVIPPILGARRTGSMLRELWLLSSNDNPYSDWALIDIHGRITDTTERLRQQAESMEASIQGLRKRSIVVHLVEAREPQTVPLGFASPYAFLLVEMLAEFDFMIRNVKTLESISRISSDEAKKVVAVEVTAIRSMFELISKYERILTRDRLNQLSRADWLPGASAEAQLRVQAIISVFGVVPREVFTGEVSPRHTRRDMRVAPETLQVLSQLELNPKAQLAGAGSANGGPGAVNGVLGSGGAKLPALMSAPAPKSTTPADLVAGLPALHGTTNRRERRTAARTQQVTERIAAANAAMLATAPLVPTAVSPTALEHAPT